MEKSFEQILRSRMAEMVNVKDKAGNTVKQVTLMEAAINI